jgi:hypothetical protein
VPSHHVLLHSSALAPLLRRCFDLDRSIDNHIKPSASIHSAFLVVSRFSLSLSLSLSFSRRIDMIPFNF